MPTEEEEKSKRKTGSKWNKVRELFRGVSLKGDDPADCVRVKMIHDAYLEEVARSIQTDEDGQEYKMLRMTPEQLESHKLINKNGVLHFRINSSTLGDVYKIASTIGGEGSGERDHQSFIIAKNGAFYVANHRGQYFTDRKNFTHVSFLGGRPAELAGTIAINNQGKITEITNNSSHYQPDKLDMYRGIRRLQREMPGVFGDRCIVRLLGVSSKRIVDFISEMEAIDPKTQKPLHEILRQKRVDDRQKEVAYLKSDFPERDYFEKIIDSFNISRGQRLDPRLFLYQDPQSSIRTKLEAIMKSRKELRNPSAPMQLLIDKLKENNKLEEFLEMRISGYPNPMLFALDKGYLEALDVMLKNGVDVDCKIDGTPMIYYALDSKASLDFMVSKGADINALDKSGNTLMHKALKSREAGKVIKYLHDKGLDINAVDRNNETPLMLAVIMYDYYKNSCDDESAEANAYRLRQIIGVLRELGAVSALEKLPIVQENLEKNALKAESSAIGNTLQGFVSAEKGVAKKPTEKPGDSNRFAYWWL